MNYKQASHALYVASAVGVLLSISFQSTASENKRLAFSKKAGVEVLAQGTDWCSDTAKIALKVTSDDFFSSGQAASFMKKIGKAVLPAECPQAENAELTGISSSSSKILFTGSASKSESWTLVSNNSVSTNTKATVDKASEVKVTTDKTVEAKEQAIAEAVDNKVTQIATAKKELQEVASNVIADKPATEEDVSEKLTGNESATKLVDETKVESNKNVVDDQVSEVVVEKQELIDADFTVADYRPRVKSGHFSNPEQDAVTVLTLDRCKIYDLQRRLSKDWIAFPKDGFECVEGRLNGHGVVEFKNIDAISQGNVDGDLVDGHFFKNIPTGWQPQRFEKIGNQYSKRYAAIFHIASNAELKTHFIGVMTASGAQFDRHATYAITERDILLDPKLAEKVVASLVKEQKKIGYKRWDLRSVYVYESLEDFKQGIIGIKADRPYVQGASYKLSNYVVDREQKRLAEIERKKEALQLRQIMRERQMESDYLAYQQLPANELKKKVVGNYVSSFSDSEYLKAAEGALELSKHRSSWMVHISDVEGNNVEIDFPTEMTGELTTGIKQEGWYVVEADLSGVIGQTNSSGYIQPKLSKMTIKQQCQQEKCNEFTDPLTVIRAVNNMPEWAPLSKKD